MRPFNKEDYNGFSGVEEGPGQPALLGGNETYLIIADCTGVGLYSVEDNPTLEEHESNWYLHTDYNGAKAISTLLEIVAISDGLLTALGFEHDVR